MYARISLFRTKEAFNDAETRRRLQEMLPARLMALPGMLECYHMGQDAGGKTAVFSVYESREALLLATPEIEALWRECAHMIDGEVEQHELAVFLHTVRPKLG